MRSSILALLLAAAPQEARKKPDFLVIAPERFHAALGEYVRHKNGRIRTEIVSLEAVLKSTRGADDPERVKRFLFSRWKDGARYALLVGDADVFPVRYMVLDRITEPAFDYAFYPSDLYYADLAKRDGSFDDWNAKKDGFHGGYYGEVRGEKIKKDPINYDDIDYRPEIAVGRWPVSTVEEVKIVAAKTIAYENGARLQRSALCHVEGWVDTREMLKGLAAKRSGAAVLDAPKETELVKLLNEGVGFLAHTGHGSDDSWAGCFSVKSIDSLKNGDRLPVMMSVGCSTARFATLPPYEAYTDASGTEHKGTNGGEVFKEPPPSPAVYQKGRHNPTGLGEQLLRRGPNGAVAYIGCNTGSQPCALTLLEGFVQAWSGSKEPVLGDLWSAAITHYWEKENLAKIVPDDGWYPASIFFQAMKFMLFGDPTLRMAD
ncbi:MAG: hypothetical protein HYY17_07065 [Planctomycetes bacterium]|nr:hypothetical protein [Planctomycetota bacterium]